MSFRRRFGSGDVRVLEDERVFDGYFRVHRRKFQHRGFDGDWCEPVVREVFERGDAVGVLPYDPDGDRLFLIEQFRAGSMGDGGGPWMLELIAGIVEPGEDDASVARREAEEEAGCSIDELEPIAAYYPSAGACPEHVRLFCGRAVSAAVGEVRGLAGEGEDILVHEFSRDEILALLADGQITNGHTLVALQWFALHWQGLRERWIGPDGA